MAQDTMLFTRFRGALQYGAAGHRFDGMPMHVVQTTLGRSVNIGAHGVDYDFHDFGSEHWVLSMTVSSGSSLGAVQTGGQSQEYGVLRMLNTAGDNDKMELQLKGLSWRYRVGKKLWAGIRWKTDDADLTDMAFGLVSTTTNFISGSAAASASPGVDDGIFFWKGATDTTWSFGTSEQTGTNGVGSSRTQINSTGLGGAIADDTYEELVFNVDQDGNIHAYVDGSEVAQRLVSQTTALPDDTELALSFAFQNGSGAARTVSVDWAFAYADS